MPYKINSTEFTLPPTTGRWIIPDALGIGVSGVARYPAVKQFELLWDFMSPAEYSQLKTWYAYQNNTGTITADLPDIEAASYEYRTFSGVVMFHPIVGEYFEGYLSDVSVILSNIRT